MNTYGDTVVDALPLDDLVALIDRLYRRDGELDHPMLRILRRWMQTLPDSDWADGYLNLAAEKTA